MKYRINYSKVISQVEEMEALVEKLSRQIRYLEQKGHECRTVWKGQASEQFLAKVDILCSNMNITKSQMSELALTIKYCADRIQRADREAAEKAAMLSSGNSILS